MSAAALPCNAVREGSEGCMLNAGHIERGHPDHLDRLGNRWATVSPTDTEPPVDEDAAAEARAYERGLREGFERAIRDGAAHLREIGDRKDDCVVVAAGDWLEEWGASHSPTDRPSEYERGRADAIRDAAAWLCKDGRGLAAWHIEEQERQRLAPKQGAASS